MTFTVAPLVAGIDKCFHFLVNWDQYLSPLVAQTLHVAPHTFMLGAGVIEIVAALLVAYRSWARSLVGASTAPATAITPPSFEP